MSGSGVQPPSDRDIREALLLRLRRLHRREPDAVFIEELGLCRGQVFVDVAVVNGALHGYEIKSDRDSLRRLLAQVSFYSRVLDRATLVVGERHVEQAAGLVPIWWGIEAVVSRRGRVALERLREGCVNRTLDPRALVELLWLEDARDLLAARDALRGYRGRSRHHVWDRVCELYSPREVGQAVRARLKARATRRAPPPSA